MEDFDAALRIDGDSFSSLWGRGQVYEAQQLPALAILYFKMAIELKASRKSAHCNARYASLAALIAALIPEKAQPCPGL